MGFEGLDVLIRLSAALVARAPSLRIVSGRSGIAQRDNAAVAGIR